MKTLLVSILLTFLCRDCLAQRYLFSSVSLFKEIDKPFARKRKQPPQTYVFNYGVGVNLGYQQIINRKLSFSFQGGAWYFFNNKTDIDRLNREIKYRNIVIPIIGKIRFDVIENENFGLGFGIGGGASYLQKINKFEDKSVSVEAKWTTIANLEIIFSFKPFWSRNLRQQTRLKYMITYSYLFIDKKKLATSELEFYHLKL